jgi:hypothetical protein
MPVSQLPRWGTASFSKSCARAAGADNAAAQTAMKAQPFDFIMILPDQALRRPDFRVEHSIDFALWLNSMFLTFRE